MQEAYNFKLIDKGSLSKQLREKVAQRKSKGLK